MQTKYYSNLYVIEDPKRVEKFKDYSMVIKEIEKLDNYDKS